MYIILTAAAGLFGSLLMFCGDMLLYFTKDDFKIDGTIKPVIEIMKNISEKRLRIGGLLGPIAAFFYCVGCFNIWLTAAEEYKIIGFVISLLACFGIILGGAYHSHFTYFGLIGRCDDKRGLDYVEKNISFLAKIALSIMGIFLLSLAVLIVFGKTLYPRWFVVFTPLATYFLQSIWEKLPQPYRIILRGGWGNLVFVIYFTAAFIFSL
ncbi:DUF6796 family protein [Treponema phagedenis]|uniref:DUF6796 family protein n=1 Tax=Treponema phagedenis TaxID=162 RepID=UPI0011E70DE5|nr:DUF6796 family protein [Treponema phagedenis]QEK06866.1 hypothetical protein FUT80_09165 [Treponema phagedenis]